LKARDFVSVIILSPDWLRESFSLFLLAEYIVTPVIYHTQTGTSSYILQEKCPRLLAVPGQVTEAIKYSWDNEMGFLPFL